MTGTVARTVPAILLIASPNKSVTKRCCGACDFWSGRCRLEQGHAIHLAVDAGCDKFRERGVR
jgi:hypothetical protein